MDNKNLKVILSSNFSLRSSGTKFYLVDLNYKNIIFEPYELTRQQYCIIKELNGSKTLEELNDMIKNKKLFKLLIKDLKKIRALSYSRILKRKFPQPSKRPQLYDVHLEFTKKCNFSCKHCYQEKYFKSGEKELNFNEIKRLANELEKLNVVKIAFSGGEPFLRRDLKKICLLFKRKGIKPDCIFTNGFSIKKEDIAWLKKESIHLFISLDGISPNSHGILRNIPIGKRRKVFNRIIKNIKKVKKKGIITKINTCIHRYNLAELEKMYFFLKSLKIDTWRLTLPKIVGRYEKNKDEFSVDKERLVDSLVKILESFLNDVQKVKEGIRVPMDLRVANIFKTEMLIKPLIAYSKKDSACDYQRQRITIKPNGDVVPCGLLVDYVYGNIKGGIISSWYNKNFQKVKNIPIKDIIECNKCKYASLCGGGCRVNSLSEFGDLFHKDKQACECMSILFDHIKKLLKKKGFSLKVSTKSFKTNKKVYIRDTNYFL